MARTRLARPHYEILEWRDRRYQHYRDFFGDEDAAENEVRRLNRGYAGPRYTYRRKDS